MLLFLKHDAIVDKKSFAPFVARYKAKKLQNSRNQANATRKRSNSITKLAEKPLTFFKKTTFGFNTPDRARYRKLIPAIKLELEKLFKDNYNEVDTALNTQCMKDFFIHYIQELEKAGIAPGEPAAIAYYLTNGCTESLNAIIHKTIESLSKELKRVAALPTKTEADCKIINILATRLKIFVSIYYKTKDYSKKGEHDTVDKLINLILTELYDIKETNLIPYHLVLNLNDLRKFLNHKGYHNYYHADNIRPRSSNVVPTTYAAVSESSASVETANLLFKSAINKGKNSPICQTRFEKIFTEDQKQAINKKIITDWAHWRELLLDKKTYGSILTNIEELNKKYILYMCIYKIYREYTRLSKLIKLSTELPPDIYDCIVNAEKKIIPELDEAFGIITKQNTNNVQSAVSLLRYMEAIYTKIYLLAYMISFKKTNNINLRVSPLPLLKLDEKRIPTKYYMPASGQKGTRISIVLKLFETLETKASSIQPAPPFMIPTPNAPLTGVGSASIVPPPPNKPGMRISGGRKQTKKQHRTPKKHRKTRRSKLRI